MKIEIASQTVCIQVLLRQFKICFSLLKFNDMYDMVNYRIVKNVRLWELFLKYRS